MNFINCHQRAWLPSQALERADLDDELGEMLGLWSRKWFAQGEWRASAPLSADRPADVSELCWWALADGLAIAVAPDATHAVASAMLGDLPGGGLTEGGDLELAGKLADACLADLKKQLQRLLRLPEEDGWRESEIGAPFPHEPAYFAAIVAGAGRPRLCVAVTRELLISRIKAGLSIAVFPIELGSLSDGLERQTVDVGARIGGCELSLCELDALGVGDVVVLDHALDLPLELALDGRPIGRRCAVDHADDRLALELYEPLVG